MFRTCCWIALGLLGLWVAPAFAQSFRVQCPTSTITHPDPTNSGINSSEPLYTSPTAFSYVTSIPGAAANATNGYVVPSANANGATK